MVCAYIHKTENKGLMNACYILLCVFGSFLGDIDLRFNQWQVSSEFFTKKFVSGPVVFPRADDIKLQSKHRTKPQGKVQFVLTAIVAIKISIEVSTINNQPVTLTDIYNVKAVVDAQNDTKIKKIMIQPGAPAGGVPADQIIGKLTPVSLRNFLLNTPGPARGPGSFY